MFIHFYQYLLKGHDLLNPITKTTHGYCATPDSNCYNETPKESNDHNHLKSSPRVRYNYHRNTGIVNCRVNSSAKHERKFSTYSSTSLSSNGILSESVASQVFAHEVGHSFGAKHDDLDEACNPLRKDNFIMTGSARVNDIIKHNIILELNLIQN